jgi:hypothetical protein
MMTKYIEEFSVPGLASMGIEDTKKKKNRYALWYMGCGIGSASTIAAARCRLHRYAQDELKSKHKDLEGKLAVVARSEKLLSGDDVFVLGSFRVEGGE